MMIERKATKKKSALNKMAPRSARRNKSKPASAPAWLVNKSYNNMELIGKGGYSRVFRATRFGEVEPKVVAIKVMKVRATTRWSLAHIRSSLRILARFSKNRKEIQEPVEEGDYDKPMPVSAIIREITVWRKLTVAKVPYIIPLLDQLDYRTEFWAIMELGEVSVVDLLSQLRSQKIILGFKALRDLLCPIFIALRRMHELGFVHRDIKPANIIICRGLTAKLSDFGSSIQLTKGKKLCTGDNTIQTFAYAPPEAFVPNCQYDEVFDTWSLLMTFYTIFLGASPWDFYAKLSEEESANELGYMVELMTQPTDALDRNEAQVHLYSMLGLLKEKPTEFYASGKDIVVIEEICEPGDFATLTETSQIGNLPEVGPNMYNPSLNKDLVEFMMRNMKLLTQERSTVKEVCDDAFMEKAINRYQHATSEANSARLNKRIYKR